MKRFYLYALLSILIVGCKKEEVYPFKNGKRAKLVMQYPYENGYYIVPIDTNKMSNRYDIYVEASKIDPYYHYNGVSVIEIAFDCNAKWAMNTIKGDIGIVLPLYSPFKAVYADKSFKKPFPIGDTFIVLNQFKNQIVPIVQQTEIYLKEYFPGSQWQPADEYQPEENMMWGKRIIGPVPGTFAFDTITVYSKIFWDCSNWSVENRQETFKYDSIKIIFKPKQQ